jgi:hypothetical protein
MLLLRSKLLFRPKELARKRLSSEERFERLLSICVVERMGSVRVSESE